MGYSQTTVPSIEYLTISTSDAVLFEDLVEEGAREKTYELIGYTIEARIRVTWDMRWIKTNGAGGYSNFTLWDLDPLLGGYAWKRIEETGTVGSEAWESFSHDIDISDGLNSRLLTWGWGTSGDFLIKNLSFKGIKTNFRII